MGAFQQMGHDSQNLLRAKGLEGFRGAILSPVNYDEPSIASLIQQHQAVGFELVFDTQIYYPNTDRGSLPGWRYFPSDVDSADQDSKTWWDGILNPIVQVVKDLGPSSVCSPVVVPRAFSDDYYALSVEVGDSLKQATASLSIDTYQSVLVRHDDMAIPGRAEEIASVVSGSTCDRVYLVLVSDVEPRREYRDTDSVRGFMRLISMLERAGIKTLVGYSGSDLILWKAAGASDCASGKFFNLRRFTPSRFAPPSEGGGQVPYWFEEGLMAFLRESDLIRVRRAGALSAASNSNPFATEILSALDKSPGSAWIALSWRQYLHWFSDFESRMRQDTAIADRVLAGAEETWDSNKFLMEERANDSGWLRPWRRAIAEFAQGS